MGKEEPRPCYNSEHTKLWSYAWLSFGVVVSVSHSEKLVIGWGAEAWHPGKLLDPIFEDIWLRAIKGKIPKISFLCIRCSDERLFPGIFESILAQLLKGNLKQFLFLYVWRRHTFICLELLLIICSQGVCVCLAQVWKRVW